MTTTTSTRADAVKWNIVMKLLYFFSTTLHFSLIRDISNQENEKNLTIFFRSFTLTSTSSWPFSTWAVGRRSFRSLAFFFRYFVCHFNRQIAFISLMSNAHFQTLRFCIKIERNSSRSHSLSSNGNELYFLFDCIYYRFLHFAFSSLWTHQKIMFHLIFRSTQSFGVPLF